MCLERRKLSWLMLFQLTETGKMPCVPGIVWEGRLYPRIDRHKWVSCHGNYVTSEATSKQLRTTLGGKLLWVSFLLSL